MAAFRKRSEGLCHPGHTKPYGDIGFYCRTCDMLYVFEGEEVPPSYDWDLDFYRDPEDDFEIVWGVMSYDDLTGSPQPTNYTLNDLMLIHWKEDDTYSVDVETIYDFEGREAAVTYLSTLLNAFTDWMKEQGYDTDTPPTLQQAFGPNDGRFDTIEQAYADFKMRVKGVTHYEKP